MQASSAVISFQLEDWGKQYDWAVVDSGLVKSYYEDIGYFRYLFTYPGRRFSEYEIRFPAGARATAIRTRPFGSGAQPFEVHALKAKNVGPVWKSREPPAAQHLMKSGSPAPPCHIKNHEHHAADRTLFPNAKHELNKPRCGWLRTWVWLCPSTNQSASSWSVTPRSCSRVVMLCSTSASRALAR